MCQQVYQIIVKYLQALLAIALGANIVEVHITENKKDGLPDSTSSIDLNELKLLVAAKKLVLCLRIK